MRHGRLRTLLEFQSEMKTPDGAGGFVKSWMTDARAWAEDRPEKGEERIKQGRLRSELATTVTIMWNPNIATLVKAETHRVWMDDKPWQIEAIFDPDKRKRRLTVQLRGGVNT